MTLARITPKVGGIPALHTFRCDPCGHVVTEEVPIAARYHRPPTKTWEYRPRREGGKKAKEHFTGLHPVPKTPS